MQKVEEELNAKHITFLKTCEEEVPVTIENESEPEVKLPITTEEPETGQENQYDGEKEGRYFDCNLYKCDHEGHTFHESEHVKSNSEFMDLLTSKML